jgi:hypothetical protein
MKSVSKENEQHDCSVTTCYYIKLTSDFDSEGLVPEAILSNMAGMVVVTNAERVGIHIYPVVAHFHSKRWADQNSSVLMNELTNLVSGPRDWSYSSNKPNLWQKVVMF